MKPEGSATVTSNYKIKNIILGVVLCLALLPLAALANDSQPANSGWSLVPENTNNTRPIYTLNPMPTTTGRVETTRSQVPLDFLSAGTTPLFFELQSSQFSPPSSLNNAGQLSFAGALAWQPLDQIVMALGLSNSIFDNNDNSANHFQQISNISCESALLEPGVYHASNCRFTDGGEIGGQLISRFTSLGATWSPNISARTIASLQLDYFQQQTAAAGGFAVPNLFNAGSNQLTNNRGLLPVASMEAGTTLEGVGVNLALGINHDSMGKLQLGLQLSRINHVEVDKPATNYGFNNSPQTALQLTPIAPYNTATVSFDWGRGSFSGGVQGFYREPLTLYNQQNTDGLAGFDIYFSWNTPWNANLSIGTSTIIDAGNTNKLTNDSSDPFETIYGRVPYVRYQQDL